MNRASEPGGQDGSPVESGTGSLTIQALTRGAFLLVVFGIIPSMGGCHGVFRWPWAFKPETGRIIAMFLAAVWPLAIQGAYAPAVRGGPRRADVLAHLGLCLAAALAAWILWGDATILVVSTAGTALGLLPFAAQALQCAWGLPLTCMNSKAAAGTGRKLPATGGNLARVAVSTLFAPLDGLFFFILLALFAGPAAYSAVHDGLWESAHIVCIILSLAYLVLFIIRLGQGLRRSITAKRILTVSAGYGVLAAGVAALFTMPGGLWHPAANAAVGALFGGWLAYFLNLDSRLEALGPPMDAPASVTRDAQPTPGGGDLGPAGTGPVRGKNP